MKEALILADKSWFPPMNRHISCWEGRVSGKKESFMFIPVGSTVSADESDDICRCGCSRCEDPAAYGHCGNEHRGCGFLPGTSDVKPQSVVVAQAQTREAAPEEPEWGVDPNWQPPPF